MLKQYNTQRPGLGCSIEPVSIIYDNTTKEIERLEQYGKIDNEKIRDFCECYNKSKKLTVDEYNNNIEVIIAIYKEMTSKSGLERIIDVFPKRHSGLFDTRKIVSIAKCLNVKCNGTKHGYICNELRVKAINSRVLEIEYKTQNFLY